MPVAEINYWAVLVAGLLSVVLGFVWYSPKVFGKRWLKESGLSLKDTGNRPGTVSVVMAGSLVQAYVLAHFIDFTNALSAFEGAVTGTWLWVGFVATAYTATYIFSQKSFGLWATDSFYFLTVLIAQGILLATWV